MEDQTIVKAFKELIDSAHDSQNDFLIKLLNEHESGAHHRFIELELRKEEKRARIMERLTGNIIFWGFTALMAGTSAAGWWIWKHLKI